jgi:hypothetical protein
VIPLVKRVLNQGLSQLDKGAGWMAAPLQSVRVGSARCDAANLVDDQQGYSWGHRVRVLARDVRLSNYERWRRVGGRW